MKALSILIICSMLINANLFSQSPEAKPPVDLRKSEKLQQDLDLTDDQLQQLEGLISKRRQSNQEHSEKMKILREQHRQEMQQERELFQNELETFLTEEQIAELNDRQKERIIKRKQRRKGAGTFKKEFRKFNREQLHPQMRSWRKEFDQNIEPADQQRIQELRKGRQEFGQGMKALKEELNRKNASSREDFRAKVKELRDSYKDQREEIQKLSEKYQDDMHAFFEQRSDQMDSWRKELRRQGRRHKNSMKTQGQKRRKQDNKKHRLQAPHTGQGLFLLLDPEENNELKE